ncbi:MAG: S41 family peptidase [Paraprevotella sp.]|nr:S41 family peptidase [Paraprevotella sp.]MBP3472157.1 S41 family peptidase [Paraprevotella sp.]
MRKLHLLLYSLFALLTFSGCIREEEIDNTPQGNLYALWKIIDERYCFLDYKAQACGLDWESAYSRYSNRLSDGMNNYQLFEVMCDMLSELQDGHVNLSIPSDMGRYWAWYEDYPDNFSATLVERNYLGTDYKIAGGIKYRILDDNTGYLYYESFSSGIGEGNLDEIMHYLRACNGLIVDVRSNSGGRLDYAERLAQRFTNETILTGYTAHKTGMGHNDFSTPAADNLTPSTGIRWQKRAVVLTNRRCYSATNTFVRDMKECPLVTIMGDRTGGGSGLPFSSELPNGWLVRFSACPMYDARMEQIEFGIAPDIVVSQTEEDTRKGIDTLIEAARTFLRK